MGSRPSPCQRTAAPRIWKLHSRRMVCLPSLFRGRQRPLRAQPSRKPMKRRLRWRGRRVQLLRRQHRTWPWSLYLSMATAPRSSLSRLLRMARPSSEWEARGEGSRWQRLFCHPVLKNLPTAEGCVVEKIQSHMAEVNGGELTITAPIVTKDAVEAETIKSIPIQMEIEKSD